MLNHLKAKAFFVAILLHIGVGMLVFGLFQLAMSPQVPQHLVSILAIGTLATYGSVVLAVAFVYVPLAPWIRRADAVVHWKRFLWRELPTILALIPVAMGIFTILRKAWNELKTSHRREGELNLEKVSAVVTKVATDTQALLKERPVNERAA